MDQDHRLVEVAARATGDVNHNGSPPPQCAFENPLLEILVREVSDHIPAELRGPLWKARNAASVMDWIGIAVIYRWLPHQDQPAFIKHLAADPRRTVVAWALTRRLMWWDVPLGREFFIELAGLFLMALLILVLLATRCLIQAFILAGWDFGDPGTWVQGIVFLPLMEQSIAFGTAGAAAMALALFWMILEVVFGPDWLWGIRNWPARQAGIPFEQAPRPDGVQFLWFLQGVLMVVALLVRCLSS